MKQVSFHEDARAELAEASHYYEDRVPGLGQALIDDVENAVSEIIGHPKACKLISKNLRRKLLNRFPYGLIYAVEPDRINHGPCPLQAPTGILALQTCIKPDNFHTEELES